jgi:ATP-dependent helicase YprA (DUF1998 family)
MIYREEMQKAPPDILITNFTMLDITGRLGNQND